MNKKKSVRIRVCFHHADDTYLYVKPVDSIAEDWLRVRYNVPGVIENFAATVSCLLHCT